jgi:DNA-binding LacI/PurR family transcriptional regulator
MAAPERPSAFFVWSDEVAFGLLARLRELGIRVPEDVSVIGFDSLEACDRSVPPLTSVRQPIVEMARRAVRLLVAFIQGDDLVERHVSYPLLIDLRGSTAPCPPPHTKECFLNP